MPDSQSGTVLSEGMYPVVAGGCLESHRPPARPPACPPARLTRSIGCGFVLEVNDDRGQSDHWAAIGVLDTPRSPRLLWGWAGVESVVAT